MSIYKMQRPASSVVTMKFHSYDAAIDFAAKSGMMKPSKPYKRMMSVKGEIMPVWCVTMPQTKPDHATYLKAA